MNRPAEAVTGSAVRPGRRRGEPVLLLHGWPDTHALWQHQVAALTAAGYRIIAPDLRGFGESDKPADISAYGMLHVLSATCSEC